MCSQSAKAIAAATGWHRRPTDRRNRAALQCAPHVSNRGQQTWTHWLARVERDPVEITAYVEHREDMTGDYEITSLHDIAKYARRRLCPQSRMTA